MFRAQALRNQEIFQDMEVMYLNKIWFIILILELSKPPEVVLGIQARLHLVILATPSQQAMQQMCLQLDNQINRPMEPR